MNAAVQMQSCPDHETLSAFIDDRLDPESRATVVQHLAECGDCRDLVVAANEYAREEGAEQNVVRGGWQRTVVPAAVAAAVVGILFGVPQLRDRLLGRSGMSQLVAAADRLPERPIDARLSADFDYRDYIAKRGRKEEVAIDAEVAATQLRIAALRVEERLEKRSTPENLHAAGVGRLLTNEEQGAVEALERAAQASPDSAAVLSDLAAAYIARGDYRRGDYERALEAANKAYAIEPAPAAAWNRALALKWLDRREAAIEAWKQYLALDSSSPWADEARETLQYLQEE